jgi:hypothetical protein
MEALRRQMSDNLEKLRRAGRIGSPARSFPAAGPRPAPATVRETVARRVRMLEADDPQFQEKATDIFVESILLSEFGEGLVNNPGFRILVREVGSALGADATLAKDLSEMFAQIRGPATR